MLWGFQARMGYFKKFLNKIGVVVVTLVFDTHTQHMRYTRIFIVAKLVFVQLKKQSRKWFNKVTDISCSESLWTCKNNIPTARQFTTHCCKVQVILDSFVVKTNQSVTGMKSVDMKMATVLLQCYGCKKPRVLSYLPNPSPLKTALTPKLRISSLVMM